MNSVVHLKLTLRQETAEQALHNVLRLDCHCGRGYVLPLHLCAWKTVIMRLTHGVWNGLAISVAHLAIHFGTVGRCYL